MVKILFSILLSLTLTSFALAKTKVKESNEVSCTTNKLNILALFLNIEDYYKYIYALSMARVDVDPELIRRSVEVEEKEILDPGNPQYKKMQDQQIKILQNILINSGCSEKDVIKFKYEFLKELKKAIATKNTKKETSKKEDKK